MHQQQGSRNPTILWSFLQDPKGRRCRKGFDAQSLDEPARIGMYPIFNYKPLPCFLKHRVPPCTCTKLSVACNARPRMLCKQDTRRQCLPRVAASFGAFSLVDLAFLLSLFVFLAIGTSQAESCCTILSSVATKGVMGWGTEKGLVFMHRSIASKRFQNRVLACRMRPHERLPPWTSPIWLRQRVQQSGARHLVLSDHFRAARLQNEIAPENNFEVSTKNGKKNARKDPKK